MMNRTPLQISQKVLKTLYRDPQEEFPPFKIDYFVAHFRYNSTVHYYKDLFNEVSLLDLHVINKISWYIAIYTRCLKKINNNNFFLQKGNKLNKYYQIKWFELSFIVSTHAKK